MHAYHNLLLSELGLEVECVGVVEFLKGREAAAEGSQWSHKSSINYKDSPSYNAMASMAISEIPNSILRSTLILQVATLSILNSKV